MDNGNGLTTGADGTSLPEGGMDARTQTATSNAMAPAIGSATKPFIVGIGASAGGLEVLRSIFAALPPMVGASFVVVQHMAPKYRSMLAELLGRDAKLTVKELEDGVVPQVDTIYVTPPKYDSYFADGQLRLTQPAKRIAPKPSVDHFFKSLAESLRERCAGIILSGTGSDGAEGVRAIKAVGGLAIVQDPETAKYDGMPRAAINTGLVDLVLAPEQIANQIGSLVDQMAGNGELPPSELDHDDPFKAILDLIRRRLKVDFRQYKPNTLKRRIERRMHATRMNNADEYYDFLKGNYNEATRLFQDILISVTAFFRDREQFDALAIQVRELIQTRNRDEPLRIWCAGASTGEEPYSLAIMCLEVLATLNKPVAVQIFATDINEENMTVARKGLYKEAAVSGMPDEYLAKYFVKVEEHYQIKRHVRELVVFARHDLTRDPPFLKMDLISCRNVFIYFDQTVQERLIKIFHYALNHQGILFLGRSESVGGSKAFFKTIDQNGKIWQRHERPSDPSISFSRLQLERSERKMTHTWRHKQTQKDQLAGLIKAFAPDAIVVDEDFAIRQVFGEARKYIELPEGDLYHQVDRLISRSIRNKILTLLHRAKRRSEICRGSVFELADAPEGGRQLVQPTIYPLKSDGEVRFVVSFVMLGTELPQRREAPQGSSASLREIEELERELSSTREHLQTVIEEQETSNEELQALNEELHSANEELQSTNEELETSNEELQSTNEELTTLNEELNVKSGELLDLNNYLTTIQDAIQYPILAIDRNLNLIGFNRCAERTLHVSQANIFKNYRLIPSHPTSEAAFDIMEECIREGSEKQLQISSLRHDYEVRCHPIFNHQNKLDGAVISFVDNSQLSEALRKTEASEKKLKSIFGNIPAMVMVRDTFGLYSYVNEQFCVFFGLRADEVIGSTDAKLFGIDTANERRRRDIEIISTGTPHSEVMKFNRQQGEHSFIVNGFPLYDEHNRIESVCYIAMDISKQEEAGKRLSLFKEIVSASNQGLLIFEKGDEEDEHRATFASKSICQIMDIREYDLVGRNLTDVLRYLLNIKVNSRLEELGREIVKNDKKVIEFRNNDQGELRWYEIRVTHFKPEGSTKTQVFLIIFDVTERKKNEETIQIQQEEVIKAGKLASLGEMAAGIAHELNTPLNTIQSYVDLVRRTTDNGVPDKEITLQAIDNIEDTVTRISEIVIGLRTFAKLDRRIESREYDLLLLMKEVVKICDLHLRNKGVKLQIVNEAKDLNVKCQPTQLSQVFINLINNAVDAIKRFEEKWIRIELSDEADSVKVRVVDSGDGIPDQLVAKVMTPFFTTKDEGTGLGLSLSRSIIKAHQGELMVNQAYKNTCFEVVLPRGDCHGGK